MKRFALILLVLTFSLTAKAQDDKFASLDGLLDVYVKTIESEALEVKQKECDFMISSASDTSTMEHIARKLFDYYADAPVMGDEAVAVYLYDRWYAPGILSMGSEFEKMDAEIFATFNRNNLLGMDAPVVELYDPDDNRVRVPSEGRTSVLFFFDLACSKCRLFVEVLPDILSDTDFPIDFYAIYAGCDKDMWEQFRRDFVIQCDNVRLFHLWDPEFDSDYQRQYGVVSTPKMFVVEPTGTIIGRRLEPESLKELLPYAGAVQGVYDEFIKSE